MRCDYVLIVSLSRSSAAPRVCSQMKCHLLPDTTLIFLLIFFIHFQDRQSQLGFRLRHGDSSSTIATLQWQRERIPTDSTSLGLRMAINRIATERDLEHYRAIANEREVQTWKLKMNKAHDNVCLKFYFYTITDET